MQLMLSELEQLRADYGYLNTKYEDLQARHEKLRTILKHMLPEKTGSYFITGQGGMVATDGLPDYIFVCPAYGVDWVYSYKKEEGPHY